MQAIFWSIFVAFMIGIVVGVNLEEHLKVTEEDEHD